MFLWFYCVFVQVFVVNSHPNVNIIDRDEALSSKKE